MLKFNHFQMRDYVLKLLIEIDNISCWKRGNIMKNFDKYERQYFLPPVCEYDWAKKIT